MPNRLLSRAAVTLLAATCVGWTPVRAEIIGFEDVDTSAQPDFPYAYLTDVYRGLTWDGERGSESWIVTAQTELWLGVPA
ncbi:MAG: hypothetical protein ACLGI6_21880, partial [Gammaproteobacteria bacterium]